MTTKDDLGKAIAAAQQTLGNYSMFAASTQDQQAKQMFAAMAHDMERHLKQLSERLGYINQNEPQ